jgi:heat shock protein HslJ
MTRSRLLTTAIAIALVTGVPGTAVAQGEELSDPEGPEWALTRYYDEEQAETVVVPFEVLPTLRLEDGTASGFAGCNQFSGGYELDGDSLSFGEELSVTLALCDGPAQVVEDHYLAGLGSVDSWFIDENVLQLYDGLGDIVLTFEIPSIRLTASQMVALTAALETMGLDLAALQTEIETLREEKDALNVPKLRERIKTLEAESKKAKSRLKELESSPVVDPAPAQPTAVEFSSPEKVLLKGIPSRIANHCAPRRSSLPKGTKAAVTCRPKTNVVSSVDYYLLEGQQAASEFGTVMQSYNVPEPVSNDATCEQGVKTQRYTIGNGWQAEGCYRENKRAQLHFIDNATNCKKLKVGGKTVPSPALYISLEGTNSDVARLYEWATKNLGAGSGQLTSITQPIPSKLGTSPSCPT